MPETPDRAQRRRPSPNFAAIAAIPLMAVAMITPLLLVHTYDSDWPILLVWFGLGAWDLHFPMRKAGGSRIVRTLGALMAFVSVVVSGAALVFFLSRSH